jgi:hypothetical protein
MTAEAASCGWIGGMEGLGFRFWGRMAGLMILLAVGLLIIFLILNRAFYAWGAFGALLFVAAVLLGIAWFYDRRQVARYDES